MHPTHTLLRSLISMFAALCVCACWLPSPPDMHHRHTLGLTTKKKYCVLTPVFIVTLLDKLISRLCICRDWPLNKKQWACVRTHMKDHHKLPLACQLFYILLQKAFSGPVSRTFYFFSLGECGVFIPNMLCTISPLFTASSQIPANSFRAKSNTDWMTSIAVTINKVLSYLNVAVTV